MHAHARNEPPNVKGCFNLFLLLVLVHQRALIIPVRDRFGKDVFRSPCLMALALIFVWTVLTKDIGMLMWLLLWVIYYFKRKREAYRLERDSEQVYSYHDGCPIDAMKFTSNERLAKMVIEPLELALLSFVMFWIYAENNMPMLGLPLFYLLGVFTLPVVEKVKQAIWERKIQGMVNSRIEQEALMRDFKDRM